MIASEAIPMNKPAPVRKTLELYVEGKIVSHRRHENRYYTVLRCAAEDEYSHPSTIEVRSEQKLGDKDEVFKGSFKVTGSIRTFRYPDKNTGELKTGNESRVFFDLVD